VLLARRVVRSTGAALVLRRAGVLVAIVKRPRRVAAGVGGVIARSDDLLPRVVGLQTGEWNGWFAAAGTRLEHRVRRRPRDAGCRTRGARHGIRCSSRHGRAIVVALALLAIAIWCRSSGR